MEKLPSTFTLRCKLANAIMLYPKRLIDVTLNLQGS
jgi:hypothetical protein